MVYVVGILVDNFLFFGKINGVVVVLLIFACLFRIDSQLLCTTLEKRCLCFFPTIHKRLEFFFFSFFPV